jgi:hypothetical protein
MTTKHSSAGAATTATLPASRLSFTIRGLHEATGIGRTKIYDDLATGRLHARKHGKRTIILMAEARRWLKSLPVAQFSRQTAEVVDRAA